MRYFKEKNYDGTKVLGICENEIETLYNMYGFHVNYDGETIKIGEEDCWFNEDGYEYNTACFNGYSSGPTHFPTMVMDEEGNRVNVDSGHEIEVYTYWDGSNWKGIVLTDNVDDFNCEYEEVTDEYEEFLSSAEELVHTGYDRGSGTALYGNGEKICVMTRTLYLGRFDYYGEIKSYNDIEDSEFVFIGSHAFCLDRYDYNDPSVMDDNAAGCIKLLSLGSDEVKFLVWEEDGYGERTIYIWNSKEEAEEAYEDRIEEIEEIKSSYSFTAKYE